MITLISGRLISLSTPYSVVDLPEPVGPVTSRAPVGLRTIASSVSRIASESPSSVNVGGRRDLSRRRITTPSPSTVGSTATRMSSGRPATPAASEIRPSCGLRRSAMSSFASTLSRVVTAEASRFGSRCISWRIPSIRMRTTSESGERVEVQVARAVLGRLEDDRVDEAHERRVGDPVVGLEVLAPVGCVALLLDERRPLPHLGGADDPA